MNDFATFPPTARGYSGVSYYGLPAVKPSPFEWETGAYLFVGGLGGAAQLLAAIASRFGGRRMHPVVRNARYAALASAAVGGALLIADLKTPKRWYNMLRIFRRTSPMSIGAYILASFGTLSAACAAGELAAARSPSAAALPRMLEWPAAAAGTGMMTYTGALFSATSNPMWVAEAQTLAPQMATGAMASAAAALAVAERVSGRHGNADKLDAIAAIATVGESVVARAARKARERAGVGEALTEAPWNAQQQAGTALAVALPLGCYAAAAVVPSLRRSVSLIAALGILAGTALRRWNYVKTGNASAERPQEYLRFTRGTQAKLQGTRPPLPAPPDREEVTA